MRKIRVLIVDDSVVARRSLSDALAPQAGIEVMRPAANGRLALARIKENCPDVVILDVEMPGMDGLETLTEIRKMHATLPVIMFSSYTERGASITLEALSLGASDYLSKPSAIDSGMGDLGKRMAAKIRALCKTCEAQPARKKIDVSKAVARGSQPIMVLAIGSSTGGPNALASVVPELPADFPVPVVVVQHMPPMFTRLLAERLNKSSALEVMEGCNGQELRPGQVHIAPGGKHMVVDGAEQNLRLRLHEEAPENSCRPAVDVLFRSVTAHYGGGSLALVLTGMGQDGLRGCEAIAAAGGQIIAQDEASSVVWGMPGFVAKAGLADEVLPLEEIGSGIRKRVATSLR